MTIEFPKILYARIAHDSSEEFIVTGSTPEELETVSGAFYNASVKVARYVLVGTGVIHSDTPYYVEDAAS